MASADRGARHRAARRAQATRTLIDDLRSVFVKIAVRHLDRRHQGQRLPIADEKPTNTLGIEPDIPERDAFRTKDETLQSPADAGPRPIRLK
jgi:hypothetical protein